MHIHSHTYIMHDCDSWWYTLYKYHKTEKEKVCSQSECIYRVEQEEGVYMTVGSGDCK